MGTNMDFMSEIINADGSLNIIKTISKTTLESPILIKGRAGSTGGRRLSMKPIIKAKAVKQDKVANFLVFKITSP